MRTIVLAFMLGLGLLSFNETASSQQVTRTIPNAVSPDGLIGFHEFRPSDYGSQKHPLIIFLHGIGERGNGSSDLPIVAYNGLPNLLAKGASMRFTVAGQTSSFVVLSPQLSLSYGYWPTFYVKEMIKYAKANLQIDPNRIYITGLSLGGGGTWRVITEAINGDYSFDAGIAAAAPICGTQEEYAENFCTTIGANKLPVWAFHTMDDKVVNVAATQYAESLARGCNLSPAAKFTYYLSGDHPSAWINAYDTGHITTAVNGGGFFTATQNLYEWFLSNTRNSSTPVNTPPIVSAGAAQVIALPLNTVTLTGTATGTNGASIVTYSWEKTSGPAGVAISTPLVNTTIVTGLVAGTYVFTLTATDSRGVSSSSTVTITVNSSNAPPVAYAGQNTTVVLPANTATLNGISSFDPKGGPITSFSWTKLSGPVAGTISSPNTANSTATDLVQGVYVFKLTVTDNAGTPASSQVTVTVTAAVANKPPVANAGSSETITLPTSSVILNGTASSDPDGSIVEYFWMRSKGPSTPSFSSNPGAVVTASNLVAGTYIFTLQVKDNAGAMSYADKTVIVNAASSANQAPVANAGSNTSITLPTISTTLNGSASSDPDGTITSYAWTKTSGPAAFTIANPSAATTALTGLIQGVYTFSLQVTDNAGASATSTVTVTVNAAPNQSPIANAGNNISITLPTNNTTLNGSASSDPDGTIANYAWTKTSGPTSFTIANPSAATTALTGLVQGVYTFSLQVTDNAGASASSTVTVTVNPAANQIPIANAGSNTSITLPTNSTTLNGTASSDPDGTITNYAWTKTSGPTSFTIANPSTATTSLTGLVQGVYTFSLQVTDNAGASATSSVTVIVNPAANQAPIANAGSNISITLPTNSTTLNGSASSDPDGTITSYAWTKTSGSVAFTIANPSAATTALTGLVQGVYTFSLQVTDNAGASATSTVTVTVNAAPNQAPIANAGTNIIITLPINSATLNASASSDPDGTITNYAWTKTSGPTSFTIANPSAASTALTGLVQGVYTFSLQVTDNGGSSATSTVTVTVNPVNTSNKAPVANAGYNTTITLPVNSTTLDGTGSTDADGRIVGFNWTKTAGPAAYTIANPSAASTGITGLVQGVYTFTLQVTDDAGATSSTIVLITVNPANDVAPIAYAGPNIGINLPINTVTLDGVHSFDPDGYISSYSWVKSSGPSAGIITNADAMTTTVTGLAQGSYVFVLTVVDNLGAVSRSAIVITVGAATANQSPIANAGSNTSITLPTNSTTLNGSASNDPDGTITNYAWTKTSGPATFTITNPSSATTALTGLVQGVYTFSLQVTDNAGASATSTVTVTVNAAPNQAPIANAGSNISVTLPTNSTTLNGSASSDPDGTITSYAWTKTSGPATFSITNPSAPTTTLTGLVQGVYTFSLQVTDNAGAGATSIVTVTVNAAANQAPIANAGSNISITLPTNSTTLNGTASSDPDGTITNYSWTKTSGPAVFTIANPSAATTALTGLIQGAYTFSLQVTDNAGASATSIVTVTVNAAPNQAPIANAGSNTSLTLPTYSTTLNGSASSDPDGTINSYAWTKTSGPAAFTIASPSAVTTALTGLVQGVYTFTLQVTDNAGASATSTVTVTVNAAPNQAPIANAGSNISITLPTNSNTLNGSASSDPDGTITNYAWSKTSGPTSFTIANPSAASTALTGLVQGIYTFSLQVTDNAGASATSTVTVTVNAAPNQSPIANAGSNISITLPTNSTTLNGSASSDPDGTITNYSWTKTSGPAAFAIANPSAATTALTGLVQGVYTFTLQVTDNAGATATSPVTVTVNAAPNQAPIANAGTSTSITLPTNSTTLNGTASSDPDGTITNYAWSKTSGPTSFTIANPSAASTALTGLVQGTYVFSLQVKDNGGLTASANVTITVNAAPNKAPVANAGSASTITLPSSTVSLDGSASSDADGTITTYSWTQTNGPSTAIIANSGAATTTVSALGRGTYTFQLLVKDDDGATNTATKTITVNAPSNFLGYIKTASGSSQACDDGSTSGRTAVYASSFSNGRYLYTDAALTRRFSGSWSWYSFSPVLGGPTTHAFINTLANSISSITSCSAGARLGAEETQLVNTAPEDIHQELWYDSLLRSPAALRIYPNPVYNTATIELYTPANSVKAVNIYSSNGVLVGKYSWHTVKGNNTFALNNIGKLAKGLYIIDIRETDGKQSSKLKFVKL